MSRVARILLTWVLLAGAARLSAAIHPVPLEPNTDSKTCSECHEDKAKGKFVHSAIAMGCTSCHEVRSIKGVTRIKLITSTPQALCITCHADMNAATIMERYTRRRFAIASSVTVLTSLTISISC